MDRGHRWRTLAWLLGALLIAGACDSGTRSDSGKDEEKPKAESASVEGEPEELLSTDRVLELHLTLDDGAMAALADEPRKYVRGGFRHGEHRLQDVAIRFKGHRTLRDWSEKPSFKVSFSRYQKGRRYKGLKQLILDNMVEDPTMLRETLGNRAARELGLPAPRTGFAEVRVNGELFGLYTLVEPVDKRMLRRHFGSADGPLYEGEYGCDLYPGDVGSLELDGGDDPERAQVRALAEAAEGPIGGLLAKEGGLMDAEAFLRFLAVSTLIGDFDGYRHAHNYRIYLDPEAGRWSLLPWGLDRVLKKRTDPFDHHSLLARKCLADRACRLDYVKALDAASRDFEELELHEELDRLDALVDAAIERDPRRPHDAKQRTRQLRKTRAFIRERPRELRERLSCWDGERELDRDGDGHGCTDCNDDDPKIHPGAPEGCDGVDNNCSGLVDDAPSCPCTELKREGVRFQLCDLPMTWAQAAEHCRQRGGHLARIDDRDQSKALAKAAAGLREEVWWIGLDDRKHEGELRWQDGGTLSFSYWAKGEPDHYACGQDCVGLKKEGKGRWRDLHCARARPFICRDSSSLGER